ncbi:MAG TPA: ABC transporter permease [Candidatus Acidoferrales bacterium]|nr:ABC transporter permease [Candidatus Acidoferrales bacterium]
MSFLQFVAKHRLEIVTLTIEHLWLVCWSMAIALAVGIPLGILLTKRPRLRALVLGSNNVIQTIPSLALFGLLLPVPWLGARADRLTITALALYALLPIVRNTYTGVREVDPTVLEVATGMGLTPTQVLWQVELPLATPVILGGVRVAAVITIGVATVAAAIGSGGLGEFIFRGLAMVDNNVILAGAIPAAIMALLADAAIGLLQRLIQRPRR